jgi:hypothetical protein
MPAEVHCERESSVPSTGDAKGAAGCTGPDPIKPDFGGAIARTVDEADRRGR